MQGLTGTGPQHWVWKLHIYVSNSQGLPRIRICYISLCGEANLFNRASHGFDISVLPIWDNPQTCKTNKQNQNTQIPNVGGTIQSKSLLWSKICRCHNSLESKWIWGWCAPFAICGPEEQLRWEVEASSCWHLLPPICFSPMRQAGAGNMEGAIPNSEGVKAQASRSRQIG